MLFILSSKLSQDIISQLVWFYILLLTRQQKYIEANTVKSLSKGHQRVFFVLSVVFDEIFNVWKMNPKQKDAAGLRMKKVLQVFHWDGQWLGHREQYNMYSYNIVCLSAEPHGEASVAVDLLWHKGDDSISSSLAWITLLQFRCSFQVMHLETVTEVETETVDEVAVSVDINN